MIDRPLTLDWETINWLAKRVRGLEAELVQWEQDYDELDKKMHARAEKAEALLREQGLELDRWRARVAELTNEKKAWQKTAYLIETERQRAVDHSTKLDIDDSISARPTEPQR